MLGWEAENDALHAPATLRNRAVILAELRRALPAVGTVIEIASGSGEHAAYFARALPALIWQPTDPDEAALRSIAAHGRASGLVNLAPPLALDAGKAPWPVARAEAVVAINLIHIAPWRATEGLMAGAGLLLPPGGGLFLYGAFREAGVETAPGNIAFDADLRARDPAWGLRDLGLVSAEAARHGLALAERVAMPADNLALLFRKALPFRKTVAPA